MMSTTLQFGGPSAQSYRTLAGYIRARRVQPRFFGWVAQQMGRFADTGQLSTSIEVEAHQSVEQELKYEGEDREPAPISHKKGKSSRRYTKSKVSEISYNKDDIVILKSIPQIGEKKAKQLLSAFDSLENVTNAELHEIERLDGFSQTLAHRVSKHLRNMTKKQ